MKNAGLEMDAKYFEERTGIPTKKIAIAPPVGFSNKIKNKLEKLYA
jgi:hypothetical protein